MANQSYLLQIEYLTPTIAGRIFEILKIVMPTQAAENFLKIKQRLGHGFLVEIDGTTPVADLEKTKQENPDDDVYCLSQRTAAVKDYAPIYEFTLSDEPTNAIAFICIPRDTELYVKSPKKYLRLLEMVLADHCNAANVWKISRRPGPETYAEKYGSIEDNDARSTAIVAAYTAGYTRGLDIAMETNYDNREIQNMAQDDWDRTGGWECIGIVRHTDGFDAESEAVFARCRTEFGFPQDDIDEAKSIISKQLPIDESLSYDIIND